jgi:hypothetical protein
MEEKIRIETIEFDHDSGSDGEPDCRKNRGCSEKLFHGVVQTKCQLVSLEED